MKRASRENRSCRYSMYYKKYNFVDLMYVAKSKSLSNIT